MDCMTQFFKGRPILKSSYHTLLTLIPKSNTALEISYFRPTSFVNTIYKPMAEILANRMNKVLPLLISQNQKTFIHGRLYQTIPCWLMKCCMDLNLLEKYHPRGVVLALTLKWPLPPSNRRPSYPHLKHMDFPPLNAK